MNRLVLQAQLLERGAVRYTPAGLPALDLSLKHESQLTEAGQLRKVSVEIRPFFRNGIDVAATLLAQCGTDRQFLGNHHAILAAQSSWLKEPTNPNASERWANPDFGLKMKYLAEDMGLYKLMLKRGYTPVQLDRCLANKALGDKLADQTKDASTRIGVQGTPSFLINGKLQDVYGWAELKPLLDAALR